MFSKTFLCGVAAAWLAGLSGSAQAVTLASNLTFGTDVTGVVHGVSHPSGTPTTRAVSFTTVGVASVLESVTILSDGPVNPPGAGEFMVSIHADDTDTPGMPGALLLTLAGSAAPASGNNLYTGMLALAASTLYWVVASVGATDTNQYTWEQTLSTGQDGPGAIGDVTLGSIDSGATWSEVPGGPQQLEIQVDVVPEPSTVLLVAFGLAGMSYAGRRRALTAR